MCLFWSVGCLCVFVRVYLSVCEIERQRKTDKSETETETQKGKDTGFIAQNISETEGSLRITPQES